MLVTWQDRMAELMPGAQRVQPTLEDEALRLARRRTQLPLSSARSFSRSGEAPEPLSSFHLSSHPSDIAPVDVQSARKSLQCPQPSSNRLPYLLATTSEPLVTEDDSPLGLREVTVLELNEK
jgi:hypothetical protein